MSIEDTASKEIPDGKLYVEDLPRLKEQWEKYVKKCGGIENVPMLKPEYRYNTINLEEQSSLNELRHRHVLEHGPKPEAYVPYTAALIQLEEQIKCTK